MFHFRRFILLLLLFALSCFSGIGFAGEETAGSIATSKPTARKNLLRIGEQAPDFTLSTGLGQQITLSDFRRKKNVVLYFYPKDNTPGCTKEAQDFRDDYSRFTNAGAEVLGVSVDSEGSHKSFIKKFELNFPLLADVGGQVSRLYGVMGWIMAKRVTYVIGKDGLIKHVFPDVEVTGHSKSVLRTVQAMASNSSGEKAPPSDLH